MSKPKALKTARSEKEVTAQVLEAAAMLGIDLQRQNTGGFTNLAGQYVAFGEPGNSDLIGTLKDGRTLMIEVKREGFDPEKLRGEKKAHFDRQLERLQKTNQQSGIGFWVDDVSDFLTIMRHVLAGARVEESGYGRPTIIYPGAGK